MANSIRGAHVSPGIYMAEQEIQYSVKSLGITTLGLVGETQRGPAFEPVRIENWREFQTVFGGTSAEKFKDTQYPKYELPYIAKSYLSESNQLEVCRVLGLSGYNAGPAWVVKLVGTGKYSGSALIVLRSRGFYQQYYKGDPDSEAKDECGCSSNIKYDYQRFYVGEKSDASCQGENKDEFTTRKFDLSGVTLAPYVPVDSVGDECAGYEITSGSTISGGTTIKWVSSSRADNFGKFNIQIKLSPEFTEVASTRNILNPELNNENPIATIATTTSEYDNKEYDYIYSVSLNPNDNDYILKVLGTNNDDGSAPLYVESLYDVALEQGIINDQIIGIDEQLGTFEPALMSDYCKIEPVYGLMVKPEGSLTRSDVGKRFIASAYAVANTFHYNVLKANSNALEKNTNGTYKTAKVVLGQIYIVKQYTLSDGKRKYFYIQTNDSLVNVNNSNTTFKINSEERKSGVVKVTSEGLYYRLVNNDVQPVTVDFNNYKTSYQFASTPWFVSNVKGDYNNVEVNRLFRFHTISDGNTSNYEVKVSIENLKPEEGTFDVVIRNINDVDESPQVLEKYSRCNMNPGDSNYIGYKIGTSNGEYETRSKYVTVEIYDNGIVQRNSVPAGFLGYPHGFKNGYLVIGNTKNEIAPPVLMYNCDYDEDIKPRKQYFGLSSLTGVDIDAFTFKGVNSYVESPDYLTNGFHLDCRLNPESYGMLDNAYKNKSLKITVDGEEGFGFDTVTINARTIMTENAPIIGTEAEMAGSIYEESKLRKFTAYFYGGFDGWDMYRKSRTNTDDYKLTKYRGTYSDVSGEGYSFDKIKDPESLDLNQNGITSDWYAYLSAYRKFANPEAVDVNIFATPGIDLINNKLLAQEVISMLEEERGDSIYVATLPDKPSGASDYVDEMYSAEDIVDELIDTDIDSNYTCTYYPWVKYYDIENSQYIYLPVTKDVVRNMAMTDNQSYSWFPPAGLDRGDVQAVRAHYITKLADEDILYDGRINPVKTFAQEGLKIWGQKNLQLEEGQLNRIAVRRLLLRMKKLISQACLSLIFTPNDSQTKQSLQGLITPILDSIKSNRGITDYRVEISSSDATNEDRRSLDCRILFKPLAVLEYINLLFSVTPEGVSFDDL